MGPGNILYSFFKSLQEISGGRDKTDSVSAKKQDNTTDKTRLMDPVMIPK